jgi:carbonic anhydrase
MKNHARIFNVAFARIVFSLAVLGTVSGCRSDKQHSGMHDAASHGGADVEVSPAEARIRLVQGNARYAVGNNQHPRQTVARRAELATSQHPFAVVLGCADSRTSPEMLFDQGLGDLFVTREAGNVIDDHTLGTIEYAVEHLHVSLVVVLGHERCGAIAAARETIAIHGKADGHIDSLVQAIKPAVDATASQDAEATCKANVRNVVQALRASTPILRHAVEEGHVVIVGAYYDLDKGEVMFLPE